MNKTTTNSAGIFKFQSTDSIINTMVAKSCETTLRVKLLFFHQIDITRLLTAIDAALSEEPILRCKLIVSDKPFWQDTHIRACDVFSQLTTLDSFERFNDEAIDVLRGPLIKCGLFRTIDGDQLLFKISHEITDGDGLKKAVSLVAQRYSNPSSTTITNQSSTRRHRSPRQLLKSLSWWRLPMLFFLNLKQKFELLYPPSSLNLSYGAMPNQSKASITKTFDATITEQLKQYARMHHSTLNDLMLTALLRAMVKHGNWNHQDSLKISTSINLRQYLSRPDQATICNISSMECLNLGNKLGDSFSDTLKKVASITKRKKSNWIGLNAIFDFFLQSILPYKFIKKIHQSAFDTIVRSNNTPFLLTNIGSIKGDQFSFDHEPKNIEFLAPAVYAPFWNTVAYEYKGQLNLGCLMHDGAARLPTLKKFYQEVENEFHSALTNG